MISVRAKLSPAVKAAFLWLGVSLAGPAFGGNPYQCIFERNAFHLRPPEPTNVDSSHLPLPKVRLTGITTILKGKRALLMVDFPATPRERPKEESYILAEGQRAGPIEVLAIDERTAHVEVDDSGTITNLTFEKITPAQRPMPLRPSYRWGTQPYQRVYR